MTEHAAEPGKKSGFTLPSAYTILFALIVNFPQAFSRLTLIGAAISAAEADSTGFTVKWQPALP
jgi:hypothetical protein